MENYEDILFAGLNDWRVFTQEHFVQALVTRRADFENFYTMLDDDESRKVFDWLITYRFLAAVFNDRQLWENPYKPSPLYRLLPGKTPVEEIERGFAFIKENRDTLPISNDSYALWHTFYLEHYRLKDICEALPGETVFDIGGYVGDTAVYFAEKVGPKGAVYTFEPDEWMKEKIQENITKFEIPNVRLVPYALSDGKKKLYMQQLIAGDEQKDAIAVEAVSLDDFVTEKSIDRVDFMKFDIEGAETDALCGARSTIAKLRPKIALSIYHRGGSYGYQDFYELPALVRELCVGYRYFLRHVNVMLGETVLFCVPSEQLRRR